MQFEEVKRILKQDKTNTYSNKQIEEIKKFLEAISLGIYDTLMRQQQKQQQKQQ